MVRANVSLLPHVHNGHHYLVPAPFLSSGQILESFPIQMIMALDHIRGNPFDIPFMESQPDAITLNHSWGGVDLEKRDEVSKK